MQRKRKPLDPTKIRLIQVARKTLGLQEEDYRNILMHVAGVSSSSDLTDEAFHELMEFFARLGFQSEANRANLGRRLGFATAGQVATIRRLWSDYTGGAGTEGQLGHWLERTWKISALRFLPEKEARKAIIVLKKMTSRKTRS
ncbi:regulatory protein GemA [Acetobacter fabarum]|uniref:regulatory protein GemA n=1 Tax=Acetobacter fabarum TaxID=483199 RepID=UPI0039E8EDA9